jgi:hypothetical protein
MGTVMFVAALALLLLLCIAGGLWGTDSRPGFADGRTDRKDRWFFHSKHD